MANEKNLIPNNKRTKEELREITRKGGIASGKARKQKKELRELLEIALSQPLEGKPKQDNYMGITVALMQKALAGDVKAFETIRDTLGQKPVEKVEQKVDSTIRVDVTDD